MTAYAPAPLAFAQHPAHPPPMRCEHYALTPVAPVVGVRCRRAATRRVRCGTARVWAVCAPCLEALRGLWGEGLRVVGKL